MRQYTNPRKEVVIKDWPYGNKRVKCKFYIEKSKGKERACRVTIKPGTDTWNKPKKLTYARKVLFVVGDDGRTYIMQQVGFALSIMQSNMKYSEEYITGDDPRWFDLIKMFEPSNDLTVTVNVGGE